MKDYIYWTINEAIQHVDTEIYLENAISFRTEGLAVNFPGRKLYQVVDVDDDQSLITIKCVESEEEYTMKQDDLTKALAESSRANGFQTLQYPIGYLMSTSYTDFGKLSIYDPRMKKVSKK